MLITTEHGLPLLTVLDGQQLDEAARVVIPGSFSMTKSLQNAVHLKSPPINTNQFKSCYNSIIKSLTVSVKELRSFYHH